MADLLAQYEEYLATEKHASQNTLSSYMRDLHQFAAAPVAVDDLVGVHGHGVVSRRVTGPAPRVSGGSGRGRPRRP